MSTVCTTSCVTTPTTAGTAVRLAGAALLTMQAMVLGLAVNLTPPGDFFTRHVLQTMVLAATAATAALLGTPLLKVAWEELRQGRVTVELLFLTTAAGAFAASMQSYLTGEGPIYFEVIGILLVVYSFGRLILDRQRQAAVGAANAWATALSVARRENGEIVPAAAIQPGEVVEVRAGELIPVDGIIRQGEGFIAESAISGEPFAVVRRPGDRVLAGSASTDAVLLIEATTAGTNRQVDRLIAAVEAARLRPGSLSQLADRLTQWFLPVVLVAAVGTFAYWTYADGWRTGLFYSMSVLLVACPCALGLGTPLAIWTALNELARRGLIAHSGDAIERLASANRVVFDKTGTLTDDALNVVDVATIHDGAEREKLLGWLALIESRSRHPVAKAFVAWKQGDVVPSALVREWRAGPGQGVEAVIIAGGEEHRLRIGRPEWIAGDATALLSRLRVHEGHRIDVECDGQLAAVAILHEKARATAAATLDMLRDLQLPVEVWTGDQPQRAAALLESVRSQPDAVVHAGLLPEEKRRLGAEATQRGERVVFVGDGLNDAGALAQAHLGIALSSGTDLANEAAAMSLTHDDLRAVPEAISLARSAVRRMRRILLRAAAYNVAGILLAALGYLHPVAAALLMVGSSVVAAWSASRVCHAEQTESNPRSVRFLSGRSFIHALAIGLQGPVWAGIFGLPMPMAVLLFLIFSGIGLLAAITWHRWEKIPHHIDMAFGMLTLGNLGMLLGWWADWQFQPLPSCGCAGRLDLAAMKPGMWLGMLAGCNLAMLFLSRRPLPRDRSWWLSMFGGGNVGMVVGMAVGMGIAPEGIIGHFLGMVVGMLLGMGLGHELTAELLAAHARRQVANDEWDIKKTAYGKPMALPR
ncbi:MAG: heavy metal translocating P-type ATPase [Gemmataceae bacterium]|nr:heavy metal translocating P-type ATPase [Gemmataceae bacterium]